VGLQEHLARQLGKEHQELNTKFLRKGDFCENTFEFISHLFVIFRASSLLNILQNEEYERLKDGRQWPQILAGDSIAIKKLPHMSSPRTDEIKGMVIGITRKNSDTAIKLLNVCCVFIFQNSFLNFLFLLRLSTVLQSTADLSCTVQCSKIFQSFRRQPCTMERRRL
jgi:hypothetical protein